MNLEVEVYLTSRVVQIRTDSKKAAVLYGRYSESLDDKDFEDLCEEIKDEIREAIEFTVDDVRMGHPTRWKLPSVPREERD